MRVSRHRNRVSIHIAVDDAALELCIAGVEVVFAS